MRRATGPAALEKVEAILRNPAVFILADLIPDGPSGVGGRPRTYPDFMVFVYGALCSVWRSARQVEAELAHPIVWTFMRNLVAARFPDDMSKQLPAAPMRRHHFIYTRNRYLTGPVILDAIGDLHRSIAAEQARATGLLEPDGAGSWTHPSLDQLLHADGKVLTPLFRAKPGDTRVDKQAGEIIPLRHEPDAALHFEGDGEAAWGTKFVMVAARGTDEGTRVILDLERVEKPGAEASVAMDCFRRLAPLVPGAQGVVYDTALRGVHHQELLRDLGLLPINRVSAAEKGARRPRRKDGRRVAKSVHVEDKLATDPDGRAVSVSLFAQDGAIGIGRLTDRGQMVFEGAPAHPNPQDARQGRHLPLVQRLPAAAADGWRHRHGSAPCERSGPDETFQLNRERPADPTQRSRLRSPLRAQERRRIHQQEPRGHPVPRESPQPRPPTPAGRSDRLRAARERIDRAPSRATRQAPHGRLDRSRLPPAWLRAMRTT